MKNTLLALFLVLITIGAEAKVKLPQLFADGMVLQRHQKIPVWGWANANERIEIRFNKQHFKTKADKNGKWKINLKAEQAGGPYVMTIKGKNTITINNILVGEVWLCSGQSNMEFTVNKANNAIQEINNANFPEIRHFLAENALSATPKDQLKSGSWQVCSPTTVGDFSAVGYFFARKLYKEINVPIGIVHSSWGGTNVETWISKEGFESSDTFKNMIAKMPEIDTDSLAKRQKKTVIETIEKLQGTKIDFKNQLTFSTSDFKDVDWPEMNAPELWENQQLGNLDGIVWMRKSFSLTKEEANQGATLHLAQIDDHDFTYINGMLVGETNQYDALRVYAIPSKILKEGTNVIAVKILDYTGGGGIWGKKENLKIQTSKQDISLAGAWKFNVTQVKSEISPNKYPSLLFNAMINPLIPFAFKGALWYQGEANVNRAQQYKKAFPLLIEDWRSQWKQGDFPFYYVQLSTFDEFGGTSQNGGSKWAELREAQTQTLSLINTGMCVTTDIGNPTDIHPTNKQDVGTRLAAIALHKDYNKKGTFSGPEFSSLNVDGSKIILSFKPTESGLMTTDKYGYLKGFEIANAAKQFSYAKAYIEGNTVVVYSNTIKHPVAVRYGWADNAEDANLYNTDKFPAIPFRTDDWKTVTDNEKYEF